MIWEPTISAEAYTIESKLNLPDGIKLFDIHINTSGSTLYFLEIFGERSTLAVAPGDDPVGRFHNLLEATMKERGIPKDASKAIKKADEAKDKKLGIKEGSRRDLSEDKKFMKKMGYKPKGKK